MQMKLLGIANVDFDVISQRLIQFAVYGKQWRKMGVNFTVHQLLIDFKKAYGSVRIEEL
jgi:hypothetical protein